MATKDVTPRDLDDLAAQLPEGTVGAADPAYLTEPRGRLKGASVAVLRPSSVDQVQTIVRFAAERRLALVPYAGGTGLVGGQVSGGASLLVSVERLRAIRALDPLGNTLVVEAGVILADAQAAAAEAQRLLPLSLASEGSARIGGLLATNAGGVQVLRYGNMRDLCLGVEAVLPDGRLLRGLRGLRKDNAGYDLRNLLIGSEGTLGVITAAVLRLMPRPAETGTAFVAVASAQAALDLFEAMRARLGETLSAFELIHGQGLEFLAERLPDIAQPFAERPAWSVLIEASGGEGAQVAARLQAGLEAGLEAGTIKDGLLAQNTRQAAAFWAVRESIPEANRLVGAVASHDISVPIASIPSFILRAGEALRRAAPRIRINCFGHLGDGNLHYNLFAEAGVDREVYAGQRSALTGIVHDLTHQMGGSVSAEHGVGRIKVDDLERYGDAAQLAAMRAIKDALDPEGIMNPGAVLRAT